MIEEIAKIGTDVMTTISDCKTQSLTASRQMLKSSPMPDWTNAQKRIECANQVWKFQYEFSQIQTYIARGVYQHEEVFFSVSSHVFSALDSAYMFNDWDCVSAW